MNYDAAKAALAAAIDGVVYVSETESPFVLVPDLAGLPQGLAAITGLPAADFQQGDAVAFLDKLVRNAAADPADIAMLQLSKRYEALKQLFVTHLTDLRFYRAGKPQVHLFLCGRCDDGRLLALHTIGIET